MARAIRYGRDVLARGLLHLMPSGAALNKADGSWLFRYAEALVGAWEWVSGRDADLLDIESFPGSAVELLPDWERVTGLPDPCLPTPADLSIRDRQLRVVAKLARRGGQSPRYLIALAKRAGYAVTIEEFRPLMCGVGRIGYGAGPTLWADGEPDPPPNVATGTLVPSSRHVIRITVVGLALRWFRVGHGASRVGVNPHLTIEAADGVACILRRHAPAHVEIVFAINV